MIKTMLSLWLCMVAASVGAYTTTWRLGSDLIGEVETAVVRSNDNVARLARRHDVGYDALVAANPGLSDESLHAAQVLVVPHQQLLPTQTREGIVVNVAAKRLYYFEPGTHRVRVYPVGVGAVSWHTPMGHMHLIEKRYLPTWFVPQSVRESQALVGRYLPKYIKAGPENPLGKHALRLNLPSYLIHGTNDPDGVGRRVTAGCLRMYPEDIKALYEAVSLKTPVRIVNQPVEAGWDGSRLMLQSHAPLTPLHDNEEGASLHRVLAEKRLDATAMRVDQSLARGVLKSALGIPVSVGYRDSSTRGHGADLKT